MPKCGSMPMPMSPGSLYLIEFRIVRRSLSRMVHCWPVFLTYCLGSSQIVQTAYGCSLSAYWVPQVVQMKLGMAHLSLEFLPQFIEMCFSFKRYRSTKVKEN